MENTAQPRQITVEQLNAIIKDIEKAPAMYVFNSLRILIGLPPVVDHSDELDRLKLEVATLQAIVDSKKL